MLADFHGSRHFTFALTGEFAAAAHFASAAQVDCETNVILVTSEGNTVGVSLYSQRITRLKWRILLVALRNNAISLRLSESEREKLKVAANRLDVPESDVVRYAIEISMNRLGPLLDPESRGLDLLPVFVETGDELLRYFHLDAQRLDAIINSGIRAPSSRVEAKDLNLLTRTWQGQPASIVQLRAMFGDSEPGASDHRELKRRFRDYLYKKYLYRAASAATVY